MRKTTITILLTAFAAITFGQITTTNISPKTDKIDATPYDSTKNDLEGKDLYKYQGQELYLNKRSGRRDFKIFVLDYKISSWVTSNVYKSNGERDVFGASKYDDLAGKYFKVLEVLEANDNEYHNEFFFKLQEKESKDIIYYIYKLGNIYDIFDGFPFIVVGYFEKQKKIFVGKEFVFRNSEFEGVANIQTGKTVTIRTGQKWKCTDLTIDDVDYYLKLIFENSLGEKTAVEIDRVKNVAYTAKKADNYKKKFGLENFNLILQGKIKIGMTTEMCKLSLGETKYINKTITSGKKSEQWFYYDKDLYFDNGILTTILKR